MKPATNPAQSRSSPDFLKDYRCGGGLYTGPARRDPQDGLVPHGFGSIQRAPGSTTWGNVTSTIAANRVAVIQDLNYEITTQNLRWGEQQTQLTITQHFTDDQVKRLRLTYHHAPGCFTSAEAKLVGFEIVQPSFIKTQAGCRLFQSKTDPTSLDSPTTLFTERKHALISYNGALYFANHNWRTVKIIHRNDQNQQHYNVLLNQIRKNPGDAPVDLLPLIVGLAGCSLEESALDDGEGIIYDEESIVRDNQAIVYTVEHLPLVMGPISLINQADIKGHFREFRHTSTRATFIDRNTNTIPSDTITITVNTAQNARRIELFRGQSENKKKHGFGEVFSYEKKIVSSAQSQPLSEPEWLQGHWRHGEMDGSFNWMTRHFQAFDVEFKKGTRQFLPILMKCRKNTFAVNLYVEAAKTYYQIFITKGSIVSFQKRHLVNDALLDGNMNRDDFFTIVNSHPQIRQFLILMIKQLSLTSLTQLHTALNNSHPRIATLCYSMECGALNSPSPDYTPLKKQLSALSRQFLQPYWQTVVNYLTRYCPDTPLAQCCSLINQYLNSPVFEEKTTLHHYFPTERETIDTLLKTKMVTPQKQQQFEHWLFTVVFPWILFRVQLLDQAYLNRQNNHRASQEEDTIIQTLFKAIEKKYQAISYRRECEASCEAFIEAEQTSRTSLLTMEPLAFQQIRHIEPFINFLRTQYESSTKEKVNSASKFFYRCESERRDRINREKEAALQFYTTLNNLQREEFNVRKKSENDQDDEFIELFAHYENTLARGNLDELEQIEFKKLSNDYRINKTRLELQGEPTNRVDILHEETSNWNTLFTNFAETNARLLLTNVEQAERTAMSNCFFSEVDGLRFGERIRREVEKHMDILKSPCANATNSKPILDVLYLVEQNGWDVLLTGSASRGSPSANDLDIKIEANGPKTSEEQLKLFIILQTLLEQASEVTGNPNKGLFTFEIRDGLSKPINIVMCVFNKEQYQQYPQLYSEDVVVRIKREASDQPLFYRRYHADGEHYHDEVTDTRNVARIIRTQKINPRRCDPAAILRVLRDIAYLPEKENADLLRALIDQMQNTEIHKNAYQETLHEFTDVKGKHRIASQYRQSFLDLLQKYNLPQPSDSQRNEKTQATASPQAFFTPKLTCYGVAHLIELLLERHKKKEHPGPQVTLLMCIGSVLERQKQKDLELYSNFSDEVLGTLHSSNISAAINN